MEELKLTANTVSTYRNGCNDKGEASPDAQQPPLWEKMGEFRVGEKRTD